MNVKKYLAVTVILLFVGVAVAPSINANISKEAFVEFTTEACGLDGRKQTVELTQEEAEEVEDLFDSIRVRLNATESREEAEEVFKEAVVDLDKYGLLGGLSIQQAQRLVTGGYQNQRNLEFVERLDKRIQKNYDGIQNFLCLIAGRTTHTCFYTIILYTLGVLVTILFFMWLLNGGLYDPNVFPYSIAVFVSGLTDAYYRKIMDFQPFVVCSQIEYYLSNGWMSTIGLNGKKSINGEIRNGMSGRVFLSPSDEELGVIGFTGIKLFFGKDDWENLYLGSALIVKVKQG